MKTKQLLSIIIGVFAFTFGNAQLSRTPDFPKIATPNAASFDKFIDNPISLYNGTPDVTILLYTIKDGAIELPIALRYNTSGIRVEEEASWVGLGWNLNVGGVITQYCVGGYDDADNGFSKFLGDVEQSNIFSFNTGNYSYHAVIPPMYNNIAPYMLSSFCTKPNPDVFYYSYPGGNGKFFIDYRDNTIHQINRDNNLKIELIKGSGAYTNGQKSFKIITDEGIEHYFTFFSELHDQYQLTENSVSYVLSKTTYPNGQIVTYEYEKYPTSQKILSELFVATLDLNMIQLGVPTPNGKGNTSSEQHTTGDDFCIKTIHTPNYTVNFLLSNRLDIDNGKKLDAIKIIYSDNTSKVFNFDFDYFKSDPNIRTWDGGSPYSSVPATMNSLTKRLKLLSVCEVNGEERKGRYDFLYNEALLPPKHSFAVDYWGYSNKATTETYIPDLEYLFWNNPNKKTIMNAFPELIKDADPTMHNNMVGDRSYDFNSCQAAILKGISYPTGGYQEFDFEPNTFMHHFIPTQYQIEKIKESYKYVYHTYNTETSSFTLDKYYKVTFKIEIIKGLNEWEDMKGSFAHIMNSITDDIDKLSFDSYDQEEKNNNVIYRTKDVVLEPGVYYFNTTISPKLNWQDQEGANGKHGSINATISWIEPVFQETDEVEVQGCGVRIKSIENFNRKGESVPVKSIHYEYTNPDNGKSSGILHEDLQFLKWFQNCYDLLYQRSEYPDESNFRLSQIALYSNNTESNPYSTQPSVGYTHVKEVVQGINSGYTIDNFHNTSPDFDQNSIRIDDCLNGRLLKKEVYNFGSLYPSKIEIFDYSQSIEHKYAGINFFNIRNMFPFSFDNNNEWKVDPAMLNLYSLNLTFEYIWSATAMQCGLPFVGSPPDSVIYSAFSLLTHQLNSYDITLQSKQTTVDGVYTEEEYEYNPQTLQLNKTTTWNSKGKRVVHTYTYPNDYSAIQPYYDMTLKNRISNVVEERVFVDDYFVESKLTEYDFNKFGLSMPFYVCFSETTKKMATPPPPFSGHYADLSIYPTANVIYPEYDSYGNPVYAIYNEQNAVFLWGYKGQYLIAEIKNATYDQVKSALGGIDPESLSLMDSPDMSQINKLRSDLPNALVTTYTYQPLIGMTSMTAPNGVVTYYEYDAFGRLKTGKNDDKNVLNNYQYHYYNQP